jgi:hypothetical protein
MDCQRIPTICRTPKQSWSTGSVVSTGRVWPAPSPQLQHPTSPTSHRVDVGQNMREHHCDPGDGFSNVEKKKKRKLDRHDTMKQTPVLSCGDKGEGQQDLSSSYPTPRTAHFSRDIHKSERGKRHHQIALPNPYLFASNSTSMESSLEGLNRSTLLFFEKRKDDARYGTVCWGVSRGYEERLKEFDDWSLKLTKVLCWVCRSDSEKAVEGTSLHNYDTIPPGTRYLLISSGTFFTYFKATTPATVRKRLLGQIPC